MPEYEYLPRWVDKSDASIEDHTTEGYFDKKLNKQIEPVTSKIIARPDGSFVRPYGQTATKITFYERKLIQTEKPEK